MFARRFLSHTARSCLTEAGDTPGTIVETLLDRYGVLSPPIDAVDLLKREGHKVSRRSIPTPSLKRLRGTVIWVELDTDNRPEQDQFSCAHELGEILLGACVPRTRLERAANRFAAELLMPTRWFRDDQARMDLADLKDRYSTASHEAIAYRLVEFREGLVVTIVDNGTVTRRVAAHDVAGALSQTEREVLMRTRASTRKSALSRDGVTAEAYPVFEGRFQRVIILASPDQW